MKFRLGTYLLIIHDTLRYFKRKHGKNGRIDIYHQRHDSTDPHDDPYTVAEHYYERTTMTHGM